MTDLDIALFRAINGAASPALEPLMRALSWLGDYWRLPLYAAMLAAFALLWTSRGRRAAAFAAGAAACRLALGVAIAASLTAALTPAFALLRPAQALEGVAAFAAPGSEFGFPSGHAASAALLAGTLWPLLPWPGRVAALSFAAAVALSRMWLGAHFPSDVAAGLVIGAGVAAWTGWLARRLRADTATALALGLASLAAALDAGSDTTMAARLPQAGNAFAFVHEAWQALFVAGALLIAAWLAREILKPGTRYSIKLAYGSLLGGILGSALDRLLWGGPVDPLALPANHWQAFSTADGAIVAGVALLLCGLRARAEAPPRSRPATRALDAAPANAAQGPLFIVCNMRCGRRDRRETLRMVESVLNAAGRPCQLLPVQDAARLPDAAEGAVRLAREQHGVVVAAGGDGTINAVAHAVIPAEVPFGVLPLGTFNYFARDNAIPLDMPAALQVLLSGHVSAVQVGSVNDRVFLVNASLGFYPRLLEDREVFKQRHGRTRWVALVSALWSVTFREQREFLLHVERDRAMTLMRASTLFVGNNALQLEEVGLPEARYLERGRLVAIGVRPAGKPAMLALALRGAASRLAAAEEVFRFTFEQMEVQRVAAHASERAVKVAIDGETLRLAPPLVFRVGLKPLRLLRPGP